MIVKKKGKIRWLFRRPRGQEGTISLVLGGFDHKFFFSVVPLRKILD